MSFLDRLRGKRPEDATASDPAHAEPADPWAGVDRALERQAGAVEDRRAALADLADTRRAIAAQGRGMKRLDERLEDRARDALLAGREDEAREAAARRVAVGRALEDLESRFRALRDEESAAASAAARLADRLESIRAERETAGGGQGSPDSDSAASAALAEIGALATALADVDALLSKAREDASALQARSQALARLTDSGLVEVLLGVDPSVEEQLDLASARGSVDEELERIMAGEETG